MASQRVADVVDQKKRRLKKCKNLKEDGRGYCRHSQNTLSKKFNHPPRYQPYGAGGVADGGLEPR